MRWEEEHQLLQYEMQWTTRWFIGQARLWDVRASEANVEVDALAAPTDLQDVGFSSASASISAMAGTLISCRGATAYAHRKSALYTSMAQDAQMKFMQVNPNFVPIV